MTAEWTARRRIARMSLLFNGEVSYLQIDRGMNRYAALRHIEAELAANAHAVQTDAGYDDSDRALFRAIVEEAMKAYA